ncbi:S41 family peptidase [Paenibacillus paeoniae]|nr:S41 family peptidase [Paenibacillus paeoniae]
MDQNKLSLMRTDIVQNYYDETKLRDIMKEQLGKDYLGELEQDFDHFVMSIVTERLSEYEPERNKRYNTFMSSDRMREFHEDATDQSASTSGYASDEHTYYLQLPRFYNGITYKKVKSLVPEMKRYNRLIIDLRDNGGGHVTEFAKVAELFVPKDAHLYSLTTSKGVTKMYSSNESPLMFEQIVILINDNTASVSELFILALTGNLDNVTLIGTETYGKEVAYSIREFKDDSALLFITSLMEGPNGMKIDGPIKPDVYIGRTKDEYQSILDEALRKEVSEKDKEEQLHAAIKYLNQGTP